MATGEIMGPRAPERRERLLSRAGSEGQPDAVACRRALPAVVAAGHHRNPDAGGAQFPQTIVQYSPVIFRKFLEEWSITVTSVMFPLSFAVWTLASPRANKPRMVSRQARPSFCPTLSPCAKSPHLTRAPNMPFTGESTIMQPVTPITQNKTALTVSIFVIFPPRPLSRITIVYSLPGLPVKSGLGRKSASLVDFPLRRTENQLF